MPTSATMRKSGAPYAWSSREPRPALAQKRSNLPNRIRPSACHSSGVFGAAKNVLPMPPVVEPFSMPV